MPNWALGNQVFFKAGREYDSETVAQTISIEFSLHKGSSPQAEQLIWQSGFFRGLNVHIPFNTLSSASAFFKFRHGVYNGGTGWVYDPDYTVIEVPQGSIGWHCMNPNAHLDSNLRWIPRDKVGFRYTKSSGGIIEKMTFFVTLEIKEAFLLDNLYGTFGPGPDFEPIFNRVSQA